MVENERLVDPVLLADTQKVEHYCIAAWGTARSLARAAAGGGKGRRDDEAGGHCQLKRPWYARRVGGAAARVGELLCSPIMLSRSSRAGPEKALWVR
jgi:hypothetical protein